MKSNFLSLILFVLFICPLAAQDFGPANNDLSLEREFWESEQNQGTALDSLTVWQEQVLLHTDKKALAPKDHLFFKAYVLTGPDQLRVSASDVLKIELLDETGALVNSQYHKITNGTAQGSVMIPKKSKSGKHYLRAYTRWMLNYGPENFFTEEITVLNNKKIASNPIISEPEVKVFPEGGAMMIGLESRVIVSLSNVNNDKIEVLDQTGREVASVKNYENGLGTFLLTPESDKKYYLKVGNKKFAIPDSGNAGYTMQINNIGVEKSVVKVAVTENVRNQEIYLRGRVNGVQLFESKVKFEDANSTEIDIPKTGLPNGIIQLQLEDEFEQVWATRPLHIDNNQLHFEIEKSMETDGELVKIRVTDNEGVPVETELSMALGQLDYSSSVENARNQRFVNDLLVLTNRLPKSNALNKIDALPTDIRYNFQEGLEFYGRAYDLDAVPLPNTKIQIVISGTEDAKAFEVETNEEGLFRISNLQIYGESDMVFRRVAEDEKDKYVKVVPYQYETPPLLLDNNLTDGNDALISKQFIPKRQVDEFDSAKDSERLITLEGVTLIGEKVKVRKIPSNYDVVPNRTVYQDPERPKTIPELLLNIPGVQISRIGDLVPSITVPKAAGSGPLLWVIDGLPMVQPTSLADIMSLIPFLAVDRIEFLFGPNSAIYGTRASGGVFSIYTRNGEDENYFNRKKAHLTFEGFHDSLSFEAYQAQLLDKKNKIENNVLYWNPALITDENGEAIIKLPKDSKSEDIEVNIKAITPDGKKGHLQTIL